MVVVPAGRFTMGAVPGEPERERDEVRRTITIARPFAVARFEVTRAQFTAFVRATKYAVDETCWTDEGEWQERTRSFYAPGFLQRADHPAVCLSWHDAQAFVGWLNESVPGTPYRLLSAAEWEYVARAGTVTPFWWGGTLAPVQANYNAAYRYKGGGARGAPSKQTMPAGSLAANPWGLHHVHGNAWEWVAGCWGANPASGVAPTASGAGASNDAATCPVRQLRGGSWDSYPGSLRAANRHRLLAGVRYADVGFRVARDVGDAGE